MPHDYDPAFAACTRYFSPVPVLHLSLLGNAASWIFRSPTWATAQFLNENIPFDGVKIPVLPTRNEIGLQCVGCCGSGNDAVKGIPAWILYYLLSHMLIPDLEMLRPSPDPQKTISFWKSVFCPCSLLNFLQDLNSADDCRFIPAEKHAAQHLRQTEFGALHLIAAGLISQLSDHLTIDSRAASPQWMP
jgi:hypothetical protein